MRLLLVRRRLEAGDPHALRVDQADGVAQHAALAGGVHALEHQQHAALGAGGPLGPEPLLQVGELGGHGGQGALAVRLLAVEARRGVGLDRASGRRGRAEAAGARRSRRSWAHHGPLRLAVRSQASTRATSRVQPTTVADGAVRLRLVEPDALR